MPLPKVQFATTFRTTRKYMQPGEQDVLLELVEMVQPRIMVEIGVNQGLTARAVLETFRSIEKYIGIDVDRDYRFEIAAQSSELPDRPGELVEDDPRFELRLRGDEMPTQADVVFIDGDHGRNAVMRDSLWAQELIGGNGMIIWHDYGNTTVEVTPVLDELRASGREIFHVAGTWLAFERLP